MVYGTSDRQATRRLSARHAYTTYHMRTNCRWLWLNDCICFWHSSHTASTGPPPAEQSTTRARAVIYEHAGVSASQTYQRERERDRERWGFHVRSLYPALPNWLMAHVPLFLMIFHSVCARKDARILIPADAPATMEFQIHAPATTEFRTSQECCLMLSQKQCKTNMSPV